MTTDDTDPSGDAHEHDREPPIPGHRYRHHKGATYDVVDVAAHTETGRRLVIYRSENRQTHARDLAQWQAPTADGTQRFTDITGTDLVHHGPPNQRVQDAVAQFHAAFGLPAHPRPDLARIPEPVRKLRRDLIDEEHTEYRDAEEAHDLTAIADALADIVYVAYGTALTYGIDLDDILDEVHRANLSKLDADGKPIHRADGKVVKSVNYRPPDVAGRIAAQQQD